MYGTVLIKFVPTLSRQQALVCLNLLSPFTTYYLYIYYVSATYKAGANMNRSRNRIEIRVEIGLNKEGTATGTLNHRVLSVTKTFRFL